MSVGWFSKALDTVGEVRVVTDDRVNVVYAGTGEEKKGYNKVSILVIWRPFTDPR